MKHNVTLTAAIVAALFLSACGGGGGGSASGSAPAPVVSGTAEGAWSGTTNQGRVVQGFVLDDGSMWFLYTNKTNKNLIAGAFVGNASAQNGSYTVSNGLDFNLEGSGINAASIAGTYGQKASISGSVNYTNPANNVTFTGTYVTDYDATPSLANVAGTYSGQTAVKAGVDSGTGVIDAAGNISTTGASGCKSTGKLTPRAKGNVFNITINFGAAPCATPNGSVTGVAYYNTATKYLYAVGLNAGRSDGVIFVGLKQ